MLTSTFTCCLLCDAKTRARIVQVHLHVCFARPQPVHIHLQSCLLCPDPNPRTIAFSFMFTSCLLCPNRKQNPKLNCSHSHAHSRIHVLAFAQNRKGACFQTPQAACHSSLNRSRFDSRAARTNPKLNPNLNSNPNRSHCPFALN